MILYTIILPNNYSINIIIIINYYINYFEIKEIMMINVKF